MFNVKQMKTRRTKVINIDRLERFRFKKPKTLASKNARYREMLEAVEKIKEHLVCPIGKSAPDVVSEYLSILAEGYLERKLLSHKAANGKLAHTVKEGRTTFTVLVNRNMVFATFQR